MTFKLPTQVSARTNDSLHIRRRDLPRCASRERDGESGDAEPVSSKKRRTVARSCRAASAPTGAQRLKSSSNGPRLAVVVQPEQYAAAHSSGTPSRCINSQTRWPVGTPYVVRIRAKSRGDAQSAASAARQSSTASCRPSRRRHPRRGAPTTCTAPALVLPMSVCPQRA